MYNFLVLNFFGHPVWLRLLVSEAPGFAPAHLSWCYVSISTYDAATQTYIIFISSNICNKLFSNHFECTIHDNRTFSTSSCNVTKDCYDLISHWNLRDSFKSSLKMICTTEGCSGRRYNESLLLYDLTMFLGHARGGGKEAV